MPLISLTIQHHQTLEEARRRLGTAVHEISTKLGVMLRRVEWAADRDRVKLEGVGLWIELCGSMLWQSTSRATPRC
jgi:hypothetical protein